MFNVTTCVYFKFGWSTGGAAYRLETKLGYSSVSRNRNNLFMGLGLGLGLGLWLGVRVSYLRDSLGITTPTASLHVNDSKTKKNTHVLSKTHCDGGNNFTLLCLIVLVFLQSRVIVCLRTYVPMIAIWHTKKNQSSLEQRLVRTLMPDVVEPTCLEAVHGDTWRTIVKSGVVQNK